MAVKFQWPWQSWRASLVSGLRRLVRLELALSEERQDVHVSRLLTSLEGQINQRFHKALEDSQNNLRRQLSFELADLIDVERELARAVDKLHTEGVRSEQVAALEKRIDASFEIFAARTEKFQYDLKALLSFQSHDIVEMLPERLTSTLTPMLEALSGELSEKTERAAHRATVEAAGLSAVIDDMRETLAGQNERLAGSQHRNALILDELRILSGDGPAKIETYLAALKAETKADVERWGKRSASDLTGLSIAIAEARDTVSGQVERLATVLVSDVRDVASQGMDRLASRQDDHLKHLEGMRLEIRQSALDDLGQIRADIATLQAVITSELERSAHRATTELTGLSTLIDDMRDMIMGQNDQIGATQYNQAKLLENLKIDADQYFQSVLAEAKSGPNVVYDLVSPRLLVVENMLSKVDNTAAEIRVEIAAPKPTPEVDLSGLTSNIVEQAANRTFDLVSPRLLLVENLLSKVDNAAAEIRAEMAAPQANLSGLTSNIVEQTANRTFDLVSHRLLPIANRGAAIEESVAEARLAISQGAELTSNLVKHLTTSVHSRLNEWENERLPAVVSQVHEVAAIGFGARAGEQRHRAALPDRYKPAKIEPFEQVLERARRDYPAIYPDWKVRLDEIEAAFAETKIGNAANARDLYSNMFASFVNQNAKGRILDVGSGVFGRPYYLRQFPAERVSGIEPLPLLEPGDFELVRGIGEYLPWPDGSFSTVVSGTSLDHCISLERTFDEIVRVLTSDGRALFWIDSIAGSPAYTPDAPDFKPADRFHLFHFDMAWLEPLLETRFEIAERHMFDRPGFSKVFYSLDRLPTKRSGQGV